VRHPGRLDPGVEYRVADACDVYAMRAALAGCDSVVHAALGTNEEIVDSVAAVYAAAEGVALRRLVYISTGSVHGQSPSPGTNETSALSIWQGFAYNTAKVRAERRLKQLRARGTVETVVLRPTIVFGPGSRWVYDFADALQAGTATVVDRARGICNSIYVDNVSHAVELALTRPGIDREVFLVSDAETVRWCDLFRPIAVGFGYDFDRVPSVSPPAAAPSFKQRTLDPLRASRFARVVARSVSPELKARVKGALRAIRGAQPATNPLSPSIDRSAPAVTREVIALQRCRWKLPNDKAAQRLGYTPPVTFDEGCRRSVAWLIDRSAKATAS
jgi:nucleoside-diphosphate-sugar epimerase